MNDTTVIRGSKTPVLKSRPWTTAEIAELRRVATLGAETAAELLGRSVASVKGAARRHRISLRPAGERRGLALGQPKGTKAYPIQRLRFLRQLRADVLAGRVDVARMERRVRAITRGEPLCPECARRPVEVEQTGLCEDCHLDRLAWAHAMEADRVEKDRQLLRERQRKSRAKRREAS